MYLLACLVTITPVVARTETALAHVEVFWVVYVPVWSGLDGIDDSGFEIDQDGPGNVSRIVALVKEDIFTVAAFGRKVLDGSVLADAMLQTKLLPELASDLRMLEETARPAAGCRGARLGEGRLPRRVESGTHCCCRTARPGWLLFLCLLVSHDMLGAGMGDAYLGMVVALTRRETSRRKLLHLGQKRREHR